MADYTVQLTPSLINAFSEGSMDTSILNGVSVQRTAYLEVVNGSNRKVIEIKDGDTFDNTTFDGVTSYPGLDIE